MKTKLHYLLFIIVCSNFGVVFAQNVALYNQYNGRFDFTFLGNTMNVAENGAFDPCLILTSSSATLTLNTGDVVENAYLYWAGSGTGDFNVQLNNQNIVAERTFALIQPSSGKPFFSAFANVTSLVQTFGNGEYTLSDLDISSFLNAEDYCNNGTNFAGWALVVVYKNENLPLNQLNIYDGLQSVPSILSISLNSLNVIDNAGAKIGFVAWEGDRNLAFNETLTINGNPISNPPLNPVDNAFNGTNSFTGSETLYNMDLDVYNIQNNINIGDSSALIELTSGQDFVMINTIVTKLNSQLPDATIAIDNIMQDCNSRIIKIDYTVYNLIATNELLSGTPIAIYINGQYIDYAETTQTIPIGGSLSSTISIVVPEIFGTTFSITFIVDYTSSGSGIRTELIETNNLFSQNYTFLPPPIINSLPPLISCNEGLTKGTFNFLNYNELVIANVNQEFIGFYETFQDAQSNNNAITATSSYISNATPKEIFVRVEEGECYSINSFLLNVNNCPPTVYNYVSANNDGANDVFFVKGLRDIFLNFELEIYNRWGKLVWTGNNNSPDWDGFSTTNFRFDNSNSPKSTYYYILNLNDVNYLEPLIGWLYFTK